MTFDREMRQDERPAWVVAHERLQELARKRAEQDHEEGRWLLAGLREGVHEHLGFGSYFEYLSRTFGYGPRLIAERIRVARALEDLPEMAISLRDGVLCWSVVRELTRVANRATESEWIDAARGKSVREIESLVAGREPGSRPSDPPDPAARRHVVRLDLSAEAYALYREARAELIRRSGGHLEDQDVIGLMARAILGGPRDEGRASYQVAVTVCERCGAGTQDASGEVVPISPEAVEVACCDAQVLAGKATATQSIPPATRRAVMRRDHGRCVIPGCANATWVDTHHVDLVSEDGNHDPERIAVLCSVHHPAVHGGRILIEGRASTGFVFLHADGSPYGVVHSPLAADLAADLFTGLKALGYREKDARRAITAVGARDAAGVPFDTLFNKALDALRSDTPVGAGEANTQVVDAARARAPSHLLDVTSALKNLGCKDKDIRRAVDACRGDVAAGASFDTVIRKALAALRPASMASAS